MNIKALLTTLALVAATSTVAMAKPVRVDNQATWTASNPSNSWIRHAVSDQPTTMTTTPQPIPTYAEPSYARPARVTSYGRWWNPRVNPRKPELVISQPTINRAANTSTYVGPMGSVARHSGFVALSQPTRIETIRESFNLSNSGRIGALKLQAVRGSTLITFIGVNYSNGEREFLQVNQTLDMSNPITMPLDLKGRKRNITMINVYGVSSAGSAYKLLASS